MIISHDDIKTNLNLPSKMSDYFADFLYRFCGIKDFNNLYENYRHLEGLEFVDAILAKQNVTIKYNKNKLKSLSKPLSFIIVSNHPHGILDGLAIFKMLAENGAEPKIVVNHLLASIKPLSKNFIVVNSFNDSDDYQSKFRGCKNILKHFSEISKIVFFPAGDVSLFNLRTFRVEDLKWNKTFIKLVARADCDILPIFIKGHNSLLYQICGLISSKLNLLNLIPEFLKKKNTCIKISIGCIIGKECLIEKNMATFLRKKVYELS